MRVDQPVFVSNQPHAPLICEIAERPVGQHYQAVAEAHKVHQVHKDPPEPRYLPAQPRPKASITASFLPMVAIFPLSK